VNCPNCGPALIAIERNGIVLRWCKRCSGAWFDSDQLDRVLVSTDREGGFDDPHWRPRGRRERLARRNGWRGSPGETAE